MVVKSISKRVPMVIKQLSKSYRMVDQRDIDWWSNKYRRAFKWQSKDLIKELSKSGQITIKGQSNGVQMAISKVK